MASFKYIIVQTATGNWPRIGTKCEQHKDLLRHDEKAIAGGFVEIKNYAPQEGCAYQFLCYGESIGLKVKSRGEKDAWLLQRCYNVS